MFTSMRCCQLTVISQVITGNILVVTKAYEIYCKKFKPHPNVFNTGILAVIWW